MSTSRTAPRITICGIGELGEHSAAGVTHVLSILGPNSPEPPDLAAFAPHRRLILRFHDVIEPARPDRPDPRRCRAPLGLWPGGQRNAGGSSARALPCRGVTLDRGGGADPMQANPEWPASTALDAIAAIR
jgi:hypothetical protein